MPVRIASPSRALAREDAAAFADHVRRRGGVVVFTHGVFDLLHPGHVRYLAHARSLGDALIVGVSSDRSVRANKGPDRPINREEERVEILLALASVDVAVIFDEDTPLAVMTAIQPDILVKGPDRVTDNIEGREVVEVRGGRVIRVELAPEFSTTDLIGRRQPGRPS